MTMDVQWPSPARGQERFYAWAAVVITVTIVMGFGLFGVMQKLRYETMPLVVHLHAAAAASWVVMYLAQSWLGTSGSIALHRRLGWFACGHAVAVVGLGFAVTNEALRIGMVPPFFKPAEFLALNTLSLTTFALLLSLGVALRRRTDWHRRLMFAAAVVMTEPAFGRLLPMPFLGDWMYPLLTAATMLFLVAGIIRDLRLEGRVHPAYLLAVAAHGGAAALIVPLGRMLGS